MIHIEIQGTVTIAAPRIVGGAVEMPAIAHKRTLPAGSFVDPVARPEHGVHQMISSAGADPE